MNKLLESCGFKNVPKTNVLMYLWPKLTKEFVLTSTVLEQQNNEITVSIKHKKTKVLYALRIVHLYDNFIKEITLQKRAERIAVKVHDYYTNEQDKIGVVLMDIITHSLGQVFNDSSKKDKGRLGVQYLEFLVTSALVLKQARIITTEIHMYNVGYTKDDDSLRFLSFRSAFTYDDVAWIDREIRHDSDNGRFPLFDEVVPYLYLTNIMTAQFGPNQFIHKVQNKDFKNYNNDYKNYNDDFKNYIIHCMNQHHYDKKDIDVYESTLSKPLLKDITSTDYQFISFYYDPYRMLDIMYLMLSIYYTIHPIEKTNELRCNDKVLSHLPIIANALKTLKLNLPISFDSKYLLNALCPFLVEKRYVLLGMMFHDITTCLLKLRNDKRKSFVLKISMYIYDDNDKQQFVDRVNLQHRASDVAAKIVPINGQLYYFNESKHFGVVLVEDDDVRCTLNSMVNDYRLTDETKKRLLTTCAEQLLDIFQRLKELRIVLNGLCFNSIGLTSDGRVKLLDLDSAVSYDEIETFIKLPQRIIDKLYLYNLKILKDYYAYYFPNFKFKLKLKLNFPSSKSKKDFLNYNIFPKMEDLFLFIFLLIKRECD